MSSIKYIYERKRIKIFQCFDDKTGHVDIIFISIELYIENSVYIEKTTKTKMWMLKVVLHGK